MRNWALPLLALASLTLSAQETAILSDAAILNGLKIPVELSKTIKADRARPGDEVRFRMAEPILAGKGVVIPGNAKLYGRVLHVSSAQKGKSSFLSLVVERAEWKGHTLPLNAYVTGWGKVRRIEAAVPCGAQAQQVSGRRNRGPSPGTISSGSSPFGNDCGMTGGIDRRDQPSLTFGIRDVDIYRDLSDGSTVMVSKKNIHLPAGVLIMLQNAEPVQVSTNVTPAQH